MKVNVAASGGKPGDVGARRDKRVRLGVGGNSTRNCSIWNYWLDILSYFKA